MEKYMQGQRRILLVSRDLMVLQTRKLMLGAYFEVHAAARAVEATMLLSEQRFDLIVLCYTLTDEDCQKILAAAQLQCPDVKILMLTVTGYAAAHPKMDSCYLPSEQGPFVLVKKSAELLGFEFRSKGRMVRVTPQNMPAAAPSAA
jgi:DNA-binding NarL/FixJ family response regulator